MPFPELPWHLGNPSAAKQLYNCLALSCGTRGSWAEFGSLLLPNSTPHPAPLQWLQCKWKHLHWLQRNCGWDVCHCLGSSVTVLRAGTQTAQASTEMLCWCATAPAQLYSQGVNTELWRCSQAPRQAQTCPGLSMHLPTGWMWPLHCQNCAKTPGNPWLLILVLSESKEIVPDFDGFAAFVLWSYKIFWHFHKMVRKEEYEYHQVIQQ